MRIRILAAGRPGLAYAREGVEEYLGRLERQGLASLEFVKPGSSVAVSRALLQKSEGDYRVALDERGLRLTTLEWSEALGKLERRGDVKRLSFLIGAAEGHDDELRRRVDAVWQLSSLTLQHELALVVLLEQLYRVASLRVGSPYHR